MVTESSSLSKDPNRFKSPTSAGKLVFKGGEAASVLIRGPHVLDPRSGLDGQSDVLVSDGRIAQIGLDLDSGGAEIIEATGMHLFPAFVDPHVHLRTPGFEYKEDLASGTAAAAAGGYCGVLAMANTDPVVDSPEVLRGLLDRAADEAIVPVGFLASVTKGLLGEQLAEMASLAEVGAVAFSDDGLPLKDAGVFAKALQYQRIAGRVLALHEEDPALSGSGVMHEGSVSAALGLTGIPSISESSMVARDAQIAAYEGQRCHFQHLSAAESVLAVRQARAAGAPVTCEVSPHHLLLTHDELEERVDTNFKMNPPLRSESDRQALIEALREGLIDCIATDHAPHAAEEKERPFEDAPMGVTGLETAFAALYTDLVLTDQITLALLIEKLTSGFGIFDLPTPTIQTGEQADLCVIDLVAKWTVGERPFASKSANSCFLGRTFNGDVRLTLAAGRIVYRDSVTAATPTGVPA